MRAPTMSGDGQTREIFSLFFFLGGGLGLVSWCSVPQSLGHVQNAHSVELFPPSILYAFSPSVLVLCRICSAQKHRQSSNWLLKLGPQKKKKWGKNKLFENVRSQIDRYGIGVTNGYPPHKRGKWKKLSNEMSELLSILSRWSNQSQVRTVSNI
jgi:hypothetical protein